jgi:tRNA nucleotidyltransferase (CCA-adding enzyme)
MAAHMQYNLKRKMKDSKSHQIINLRERIPPPWISLFHLVGEQAGVHHLNVYLVGGSVRDFYLGFPVTDFDLVMEGDAIRFARFLSGKYGGKTKLHERFGTAVWSLDMDTQTRMNLPSIPAPEKFHLDFISARSEKYQTPAALPTVKLGTLRDDLLRRDFSLNTLAMKLNEKDFGDVINDLGGIEDLNAGLIRVLHPGSFQDDPTRLFRAIRYEQRYNFTLSEETKALIPAALQFIPLLSSKRVRHELDLVMEEKSPEKILDCFSIHGILKAIHPAIEWNERIAQRMAAGFTAASKWSPRVSKTTLGWPLWLMGISDRELQGLDERLHFSGETRRILDGAISLFTNIKGIDNKSPSRCVAVLEEYPLAAIQAVYFGLMDGPEKEILHKYLASWRTIRQRTTGKDLIALKIKPGPEYQVILKKLRDAWLDGEVKSIEDEDQLLANLLDKVAKH